MSRVIKIQVLFVVNNRDFTKSIKEHYTTVDNLMRGDDPFDYIDGPEVIAKRLFTGLTDYDNIDMYTDDIALVDGLGNCLVKICPHYGVVFCDKSGQQVPVVDCLAEQDQFRIAGNKYQHPELLK